MTTTKRKTKFVSVQVTEAARAALRARAADASREAGRHVTLSEILLSSPRAQDGPRVYDHGETASRPEYRAAAWALNELALHLDNVGSDADWPQMVQALVSALPFRDRCSACRDTYNSPVRVNRSATGGFWAEYACTCGYTYCVSHADPRA